ncbi:hypothetical protein TNIN_333701 [Trichonephila inaurata madagascariensis]|uniref:Uncharacterized protein n=1 Tax=Trichonephila inaurata madagascariensis TaxID=2747483 RepID=A0A8X6MLA8_9ARAC|nr:hypothetical protein TNIN_333701 [Trichonephila inaurata madagascariensis]
MHLVGTTKIGDLKRRLQNTLTGTTMVTEIVTDSSGRTTKINVPLKISTPVSTESTTPEMMTEKSDRFAGRKTKNSCKDDSKSLDRNNNGDRNVTDSSGGTIK